MTYLSCADAAFAANIGPGFDAAGGYYGGPHAYHVWPAGDWARFPGYKLPIWVGGYEGTQEGEEAAAALIALGVPGGSVTVLDMETRIDKTYVANFGAQLQAASYKVWIYGSASTVQNNPQLNGYWIADYGLNPRPVLDQVGVRAVQYLPDVPPGYDVSLVKSWVASFLWK